MLWARRIFYIFAGIFTIKFLSTFSSTVYSQYYFVLVSLNFIEQHIEIKAWE